MSPFTCRSINHFYITYWVYCCGTCIVCGARFFPNNIVDWLKLIFHDIIIRDCIYDGIWSFVSWFSVDWLQIDVHELHNYSSKFHIVLSHLCTTKQNEHKKKNAFKIQWKCAKSHFWLTKKKKQIKIDFLKCQLFYHKCKDYANSSIALNIFLFFL